MSNETGGTLSNSFSTPWDGIGRIRSHRPLLYGTEAVMESFVKGLIMVVSRANWMENKACFDHPVFRPR